MVLKVAELSRLKNSLIKAGQEMYQSGLVVGTWGNLSARVSGSDAFLITPSGMHYLEITAEDLVLMDYTGQILEGVRKPSSEYHLHMLFYRSRPEVQAVVHTHSVYASAHAVAHKAVEVTVEDLAMVAGGEVRVSPYAPPGTNELAENAVATMGENKAVLLANHGVVAVGSHVKEALLVCQIVEKSAQINFAAHVLGEPVRLSGEDVRSLHQAYTSQYGQK